MPVSQPLTGSTYQIDMLVVQQTVDKLTLLAATVSDWFLPPVMLFILPADRYAQEAELLSHHPRIGRSVFFCQDAPADIQQGLETVYQFYRKRSALPIDQSVSGNFTANNISPRWLFQTLMEHLDEYIYFKDADSRFLAVSQYLVNKCQQQTPAEVLGRTDFDFFDAAHAREALADEKKIASGELKELYKEEAIQIGNKEAWVASRKLPLYTRNHDLAGSFGLSRDITQARELHEQLKLNHERMQEELRLARNLQKALTQHNIPDFCDTTGNCQLEITSKYIPSFHLSGDYFSIIKTEQGHAHLLLADVMGHGVRAAMVTAMLQIGIQQLEAYNHRPADLMAQLNQMLHPMIEASGQSLFATAVYGHLNLEQKTLTYTQAGGRHGAYVAREANQLVTPFSKDSIGSALGLFADATYPEKTLELESGDEIILYTDGIVEAARGDEEYTEARLIQFLSQHRGQDISTMAEALIQSVQQFTGQKHFEDDVCLVGLRLT